MDKTARIRELNDEFRKSFSSGKVMLTQGVNELSDKHKAALLAKVRTFDGFNADNDPHGEHDFVSVEHGGTKYFGKLDLYEEPDVKSANGEPVVTRVLTIMLAEEY